MLNLLKKSASLWIMFSLLFWGLIAKANLHLEMSSSPFGPVSLKIDKSSWSFIGRGSRIAFDEKACAQQVWTAFKKRIEKTIDDDVQKYASLFDIAPDSKSSRSKPSNQSLNAKSLPPEVKFINIQWKNKSVHIPAYSDAGYLFKNLESEIQLVLGQQDVFCKLMKDKNNGK